VKAGGACDDLQTPRQLRWQRSRQRMARWSPSPRRGRAKQHARGHRAAAATLRLHLDVAVPRQAQDRYVAPDAFASTTEATDNVAWPLLQNRVLTSSTNAGHPSRDVSLDGSPQG
jgi:hypothetical protein